ncbi:hypothetical protein FACS1894191_2480 [Clostridia bacterium]|nr:hypothetical protein FACS1894191_2480 [Clostridia bacterium]
MRKMKVKNIGVRPFPIRSVIKSNLFRLIAGAAATIVLIATGMSLHIMPLQMLGSPLIRAVDAGDGKWTYDLRDSDMDGIVLALRGDYFYPQLYAAPGDIDGIEPVYKPADSYVIPDDYITQRFTILLPDDGTVYRLQFFSPSLSVYINGKLAGQNGNPGLSWKDTGL